MSDVYSNQASADPGHLPLDVPARTRIVIRPGGRGEPTPVQAPNPAVSTSDPWAAHPDFRPVGVDQVQAADPWAAHPNWTAEAPKAPSREVGAGEAAAKGAVSGVSLGTGPVVAGLSEASGMPVDPVYEKAGYDDPVKPIVGAAKMLWNQFTGHPDPSIRQSYDRGREAALNDERLAQEQHPHAFLAGQLAGSLAVPMGPLGLGVKAISTAGKIGQGAVRGATSGALYGGGEALSEGKNLPEIATEAGKGAIVGTAFGGAGSAIGETVGKGLKKAASIFRGATDTDTEAARRIVQNVGADFERHGPALTREEIAAGNAAGTPRMIVDTGGEKTRALLRSSANVSPEARQAIENKVRPRFVQQAERIGGAIRRLGDGAHASLDADALAEAGRAANKPMYKRAYAAGDRPIWSRELERLTGSPDVERAIAGAVERGKTRAIADKMGGFNPGIKVTPDGRVIFNKGPKGVPTYPNLQFWDYVQRELRDVIGKAERSGENEQAGALKAVHAALNKELDKIVPEFKQARGVAASFFGAMDASEAGRKFVMSNADLPQARKALASMNPAERELFARGFASDLADKIERVGDKRDVLNSIFLNNGPARQKIEMALGPQRARQLEALLRIEAVVDQARQALGNSTTARQLKEIGLSAGHGIAGAGAVGALEAVKEHDFNPAHVIAAALTFGAARHGAHIVDDKVARRIGEMLVSNDPAILARGVAVIEKSPAMFDNLRKFMSAGLRIAAHDIGPQRATAGGLTALESLVHEGDPTEHPQDYLYDQGGAQSHH